MITKIDFNDLHKFIYQKWDDNRNRKMADNFTDDYYTADFSLTSCIKEYVGAETPITEVVEIRKVLFDLNLIYVSTKDDEGYVVIKP